MATPCLTLDFWQSNLELPGIYAPGMKVQVIICIGGYCQTPTSIMAACIDRLRQFLLCGLLQPSTVYYDGWKSETQAPDYILTS